MVEFGLGFERTEGEQFIGRFLVLPIVGELLLEDFEQNLRVVLGNLPAGRETEGLGDACLGVLAAFSHHALGEGA